MSPVTIFPRTRNEKYKTKTESNIITDKTSFMMVELECLSSSLYLYRYIYLYTGRVLPLYVPIAVIASGYRSASLFQCAIWDILFKSLTKVFLYMYYEMLQMLYIPLYVSIYVACCVFIKLKVKLIVHLVSYILYEIDSISGFCIYNPFWCAPKCLVYTNSIRINRKF